VNEVSHSVKKILVGTVLAMVFIIGLANLLIFVVDVFRAPSLSGPAAGDPAKIEAIYKAEKAKLDYLLQPLDKISSLLQLLAATVIAYIFTKETGPAMAGVVSALLPQRRQKQPVE
jgi:hypothetical protein